jgi:hypothetical protein
MKITSFDVETGVLRVELPGFPNYEVFDVPVETFDAMQRAESPQEYFNAQIWGSKFEHDAHWPSLDMFLQYMSENWLFDSPVTVESTAGDNDTPMHVACVWGDVSAIKLLLAGGAQVNARGDQGTTPIYNAVSFGHIRAVSLLLEAGATLDDPNELAFTARQVAYMEGNTKLLALIQQFAVTG